MNQMEIQHIIKIFIIKGQKLFSISFEMLYTPKIPTQQNWILTAGGEYKNKDTIVKKVTVHQLWLWVAEPYFSYWIL